MIGQNNKLFYSFRKLIDDLKAEKNSLDLIINVVRSFFLKILGTGLGFLFNIIIARYLGAEGAGVYYLALSITAIGNIIGSGGLNNTLLRFVSANVSENKWKTVRDLHLKSVLICIGVSIIVITIIFILIDWISFDFYNEPKLKDVLKIMTLGILPFSLSKLYGEILKAINKIALGVTIQSIIFPAASICVLLLLNEDYGINAAAFAYLISSTIIWGLGFFFWLKYSNTKVSNNTGDYFQMGILIKTSIPLMFIAILNVVIDMTDLTMIGMYLESDQVGIYGVARRVTIVSSILLIAINSVLGPEFSICWVNKNYRKLWNLIKASSILMLIISACFLAPFIFFPKYIMGIFGGEFVGGSDTLVILSICQFIILATGPVASALMMTGHEKVHRNIVLFSAVLNVLLNLYLIPQLGIIGAALSTTISIFLKNTIDIFYLNRVIKIKLGMLND